MARRRSGELRHRGPLGEAQRTRFLRLSFFAFLTRSGHQPVCQAVSQYLCLCSRVGSIALRLYAARSFYLKLTLAALRLEFSCCMELGRFS